MIMSQREEECCLMGGRLVLIDDYESERGRVLFNGWTTCID